MIGRTMSYFTNSGNMVYFIHKCICKLFVYCFANVFSVDPEIKHKNLPMHRGTSESYLPVLVHVMVLFPNKVYPVLHVKCIVCRYSGSRSLFQECLPFSTLVSLEQVKTGIIIKRKRKLLFQVQNTLVEKIEKNLNWATLTDTICSSKPSCVQALFVVQSIDIVTA